MTEQVHKVVIQAWGTTPVVVCLSCITTQNPNGTPLLRNRSSFTINDALAAIDAHEMEGSPATPMLAETYPAGYHPRTGQRLEPVCQIPDCGCNGTVHP